VCVCVYKNRLDFMHTPNLIKTVHKNSLWQSLYRAFHNVLRDYKNYCRKTI